MERQRNLDAALTTFGQKLRSPDGFYREGALLGNQVFEKLKRHSNFSVARVYFGGSFGKKTDVIECDLDLHVVINDFDPSRDLDKVLTDFEVLLTLHEDQLQIKGEIERKRRSLSFKFKNGIEVDLLPATNIMDESEVMRRMVKDPKNESYVFNPSFVDKQIKFMKSQDSFTHTLVRLIKFWYKPLVLGEDFKGGSAMIEAICAAVAEEEAGFPNLSMFRAFTKVINRIKKVDSLKLAFARVSEDRWKLVQEKDFKIPEIVGTREILQRKGFIIDPANSFQDFLERNSTTLIEKLRKFARITRQRLNDLVERKCSDREFILKLFEPLPRILTEETFLRLPSQVLISFQDPCDATFCMKDVRKPLPGAKAKLAANVLKMGLMTVVSGAVKGGEDNASALEDVRKSVSTLIERGLEKPLVPAVWERHEQMDMTYTIPYESQGQGYAVRCSFSWN